MDAAWLIQFTLLVPGGTFLTVEPLFVVSAPEFEKTIAIATSAGFKRGEAPRIFMSRVVLLEKKVDGPTQTR